MGVTRQQILGSGRGHWNFPARSGFYILFFLRVITSQLTPVILFCVLLLLLSLVLTNNILLLLVLTF